MKVYIAGPMRGYPEFNFPAFFAAEELIKDGLLEEFNPAPEVIFNPARRDIEHHGVDFSKGNLSGDEEKAKKDYGFDIREALYADLAFITKEATHMYMLKGWEFSSGAKAEHAAAVALGKDKVKIIYE